VHQPWSWAILHAGKDVENRSRRPSYRGPLLNHASKSRASYDRQALADWGRRYGVTLPPAEELPFGALVGVVDVIDCVQAERLLPDRVEMSGRGTSMWAAAGTWC
jgi:hypothetical protein